MAPQGGRAEVPVGTVVAWGQNNYGQTNVPPGLTDVIAVAAGAAHSLALKADGTVVAWGSNYNGQTNVPANLTNVIAIACGNYHCLAVRNDGTVAAWGDNTDGQTNIPSGLSNVIAVAGGRTYSLALKQDGKIVGWSKTGPTTFYVPTHITAAQISANGFGNIALIKDGRVNPWGAAVFGTKEWTNMVQVAAADDYAFGLKFDGTVLASIGSEAIDTGLSNVVAIAAAGGNFKTIVLVAVQNDGSVVRWGNTYIATNAPPGITNAFAIATGPDHAVALVGNGSPRVVRQFGELKPLLGGTTTLEAMVSAAQPVEYQWRYNEQDIPGATNAALTLTNVQFSMDGDYSVRVSNAFGVAVSAPMELTVVPVTCWYPEPQTLFQYTIPAEAREVKAMAMGVEQQLLVLSDGTVRAWGGNLPPPNDLTNVIAVASGTFHSLALRMDGTVVAWGTNKVGQTNVPDGLTNIMAIAAKMTHSLALQEDGTVVSWGSRKTTPADLSNVVAIAAGNSHDLALRQDGTVVAWGDNTYGQTNVPADLNQVVALAAGSYHSLALKRDGTLACWGQYGTNAPYVPEGLSNVIAIAAYDMGNLALKDDGTVVAWFLNRAPVPATPQFTNVVAISAGLWNLLLVSNDRADYSPRLRHPALAADSFAITLQSRSGKVYLLEYTDSLDEQDWTALPLVAGNGRELTLTAPAPGGQQRFYRVRQW